MYPSFFAHSSPTLSKNTNGVHTSFPSEYTSGLDLSLFGNKTPSAYTGQVNHVNGISGMKFMLLMCYNTYCMLYVETLKELHPLGFFYYISLTLICLCTTIIMQLRLS